MEADEKYMHRCLELALNGLGSVAPNPLVGCVIVCDGSIIGEGYHREFGGLHAEAVAISSVEDKDKLKSATLYVNLEPCSHHGKTPPCAELITKHQIPAVVIGCSDSNPASGNGIETLRQENCTVTESVLEQEARAMNKRFLTYYEKHRPYIILKWAQSPDGFIDGKRTNGKPEKITHALSDRLVHKWRSEEQAVVVGTNTALLDNPLLNVRRWHGKNPLRVMIDRERKLPGSLHLLNGEQPTLVFTSRASEAKKNVEFIPVDFEQNILPQMMKTLYEKEIQSLIAEGGAALLNSFLDAGLWDEARIFTGSKALGAGVKAPPLPRTEFTAEDLNGDRLLIGFKGWK